MEKYIVNIEPDGAVSVFWKSPDWNGNDAAILRSRSFAAEALTSQLQIIREGGR